jgi:hypothetical protein
MPHRHGSWTLDHTSHITFADVTRTMTHTVIIVARCQRVGRLIKAHKLPLTPHRSVPIAHLYKRGLHPLISLRG